MLHKVCKIKLNSLLILYYKQKASKFTTRIAKNERPLESMMSNLHHRTALIKDDYHCNPNILT